MYFDTIELESGWWVAGWLDRKRQGRRWEGGFYEGWERRGLRGGQGSGNMETGLSRGRNITCNGNVEPFSPIITRFVSFYRLPGYQVQVQVTLTREVH